MRSDLICLSGKPFPTQKTSINIVYGLSILNVLNEYCFIATKAHFKIFSKLKQDCQSQLSTCLWLHAGNSVAIIITMKMLQVHTGIKLSKFYILVQHFSMLKYANKHKTQTADAETNLCCRYLIIGTLQDHPGLSAGFGSLTCENNLVSFYGQINNHKFVISDQT